MPTNCSIHNQPWPIVCEAEHRRELSLVIENAHATALPGSAPIPGRPQADHQRRVPGLAVVESNLRCPICVVSASDLLASSFIACGKFRRGDVSPGHPAIGCAKQMIVLEARSCDCPAMFGVCHVDVLDFRGDTWRVGLDEGSICRRVIGRTGAIEIGEFGRKPPRHGATITCLAEIQLKPTIRGTAEDPRIPPD